MHDILERIADLATGQLPLVAVVVDGDVVDARCAIPQRKGFLAGEGDRRRWRLLRRDRQPDRDLGLRGLPLGQGQLRIPAGNGRTRCAADLLTFLGELRRVDLLYRELTCGLVGRSLRDVGRDQRLLDLDLLGGKLEDALLENLVADRAEEVRDLAGCWSGVAGARLLRPALIGLQQQRGRENCGRRSLTPDAARCPRHSHPPIAVQVRASFSARVATHSLRDS